MSLTHNRVIHIRHPINLPNSLRLIDSLRELMLPLSSRQT